jgi:hypothetical protein
VFPFCHSGRWVIALQYAVKQLISESSAEHVVNGLIIEIVSCVLDKMPECGDVSVKIISSYGELFQGCMGILSLGSVSERVSKGGLKVVPEDFLIASYRVGQAGNFVA